MSDHPPQTQPSVFEIRPDVVVGTGRYKLVQKIGHGGFGETWKAIDTQMFHEEVVVKILHNPAQNIDAFKREAMKQHTLRHNQIPQLKAFFEEHARGFLVQEFIDGEDLCKMVLRAGAWRPADVKVFLRQLLVVLDYVHSVDIIHRDVKAENIIKRKSDSAYFLVDFGASNSLQQTAAAPSMLSSPTIIGTPGYIAPEVMQARSCKQSDLYSLGATCLFLLTAKHPQALLPLDENVPRLAPEDAALESVIRKLVQTSLQNRYFTAGDAVRDLDTGAVLPPQGNASVNIPGGYPQQQPYNVPYIPASVPYQPPAPYYQPQPTPPASYPQASYPPLGYNAPVYSSAPRPYPGFPPQAAFSGYPPPPPHGMYPPPPQYQPAPNAIYPPGYSNPYPGAPPVTGPQAPKSGTIYPQQPTPPPAQVNTPPPATLTPTPNPTPALGSSGPENTKVKANQI